MPTSFPAITNLTGAAVTQAGAKIELTALYASLREIGDPLGSSGKIQNLGLAFSVATGALTCAVKQRNGSTDADATNVIAVPMRSSTLSNGSFNVRNITGALSLTISSGSTLGHASGAASNIYWYLIDNSGTLELAASSKYFGDNGIVSTSSEGGAGAADSATAMYAANARSNVPFQIIGRTIDTQTTAGTWAVVPSETYLWPFTTNAFRLGIGNTAAAGPLPWAFEGDDDTGAYRPAANTWAAAANGCDVMRFTNSSATAVNYAQVTGGTTGNEPILSALGETNVSLRYTTNGAGTHEFYTNASGQRQMRITHAASAVNYLQCTGAATGNNPSIVAEGADSNQALKLEGKGTGSLVSLSVYNKTSASAANMVIDSSGIMYRS
ncbi:hypothetical protein, partial [Zavarzinella formosa]|uniref:hypothetical protein n=1 Tax=Zavarzinella formosa TaxID=360055 RepID=UPI00138AC7C4